MVLWRAAEGPLFEYACHEGNQSMALILRGARGSSQPRGRHSKRGRSEIDTIGLNLLLFVVGTCPECAACARLLPKWSDLVLGDVRTLSAVTRQGHVVIDIVRSRAGSLPIES
jgi:hypothetical protein